MFDYFYNQENEQYLFLQLPKMLIKDDKFKVLSDSSKILYSLLLDRTSLSKKNDWTDDEGRVYIIYTLAEMMEDLNCGTEKATRLMKELKEIGLVKSIRRGLGKPNLIYVMNFATGLKYTPKETSPQPETVENPQNFENRNSETSGRKIHRTSIFEVQKLRKSKTINTYPNQINSSKTEFNQSIVQPVDNSESDRLINPINTTKKSNLSDKPKDTPIPTEQIAKTVENLHIDSLVSCNPREAQRITEIRNIIVDVLNSDKKEYKIADEIIPAYRIKRNFLQLTSHHIQYLLDSLNKTTSQIKNMKFYLIKSLYNAPLTFNNHFHQDGKYELENFWTNYRNKLNNNRI